jgi:two-component system, OmpR family, heavy metal sensor histidine kinase CusS
VEGQPVKVVCRTTLLDGRLVRLYTGGSLEDDMYILSTYQSTLLLLLPCLLGLAAAGGYFLSRRAMRPVDRMTKAALNIGIGNLSTRYPFLRRVTSYGRWQ